MLMAGIACADYCPSWQWTDISFAVWGACVLLLIVCNWRSYGLLSGLVVDVMMFSIGFLLMGEQLKLTRYDIKDGISDCQILLTEVPEPKPKTVKCRARLLTESRGDTLSFIYGRPEFLFYIAKDSVSLALQRGDTLWVRARLKPPSNEGVAAGFDYARYLKHNGVSGTAYVPAWQWMKTGHSSERTLRQKALDLREELLGIYRRLGFEGDELAVLSALTLGDKDDLSEDIMETYSISGASHVLALSGLHVGFIYALILVFFVPLWKRWRRLKPFLSLIAVGLLWAFAFLTGLSSSVVRAVLMCSLFVLVGLRAEKVLTMDALIAAAFLMLCWRPCWLFDVGFQMSFSAVAAILLLMPGLWSLCPFDNRFLRWVYGLMAVSLAAQAGVAPLVAFYFGRFSVHFLLTNLWVIPLVSLVLYVAVGVLLLTPFPVLQQPLAEGLRVLVRLQNEGLRWIEALPGSSIDGIKLHVAELIMIYVCLFLFRRAFYRPTIRAIYWALGSIGMLAVTRGACAFFS